MATKTFLVLNFLMMVTGGMAQTSYKQYYAYPPNPPSPPPTTSYYTPPKSPTPTYNNQPNYASYSPSQPKSAPYNPSPQSYVPSYNPVPPYGYSQGTNYPQAPQSYASMMYPPNSNMYNYNANSYSNLKNCTDQSCATTECCEFNGVNYVCVPQIPTITGFSQSAICARFKRCYSNGDCPVNHCCVVRLDILDATANSYGSNYNSNYNSNTNYGSNNYKTERGECLRPVEANQSCRRAVDGSLTATCPCVSGQICSFDSGNMITGTCRSSAG